MNIQCCVDLDLLSSASFSCLANQVKVICSEIYIIITYIFQEQIKAYILLNKGNNICFCVLYLFEWIYSRGTKLFILFILILTGKWPSDPDKKGVTTII